MKRSDEKPSVWEASRHSIDLGYRDVLVIDTFGDLPTEALTAFEVAAAELTALAIEHRVRLIQMGPDQNIWPDRLRPDRKDREA